MKQSLTRKKSRKFPGKINTCMHTERHTRSKTIGYFISSLYRELKGFRLLNSHPTSSVIGCLVLKANSF